MANRNPFFCVQRKDIRRQYKYYAKQANKYSHSLKNVSFVVISRLHSFDFVKFLRINT